MAEQDESALDEYLRKNENGKKSKKLSSPKKTKPPGAITSFKRWKAAAAMDLIRVAMILMLVGFSGLLSLMLGYDFYIYLFFAAAVISIIALIYAFFDFRHFLAWTDSIHFELEGWKQTQNNKSGNFWSNGGEYWVATRIVVEMAETANAKHTQVTQVFLKRLQKRLNQWTVSSDVHVGYTQPDGWRLLENHLSGDMNARVLNLIRKRLSGEFDSLVQKMPGSIKKVTIASEGKEKKHEVYHDTD